MARNGEFDITLEGVSSHAGQPHFGKDALIAAAQILLSVQNILARDLDPLQPAVVNIGTLHAGEARNIVAGRAELTGTIRSYDKVVYAAIKEVVREAEDMRFQDALNRITKRQMPTVDRLYSSEDQPEGAKAFAEKRDPVWKGK